MTNPDLDKYLERLVEVANEYPGPAVVGEMDSDSARAVWAAYTQTITVICAVLREKREASKLRCMICDQFPCRCDDD